MAAQLRQKSDSGDAGHKRLAADSRRRSSKSSRELRPPEPNLPEPKSNRSVANKIYRRINLDRPLLNLPVQFPSIWIAQSAVTTQASDLRKPRSQSASTNLRRRPRGGVLHSGGSKGSPGTALIAQRRRSRRAPRVHPGARGRPFEPHTTTACFSLPNVPNGTRDQRRGSPWPREESSAANLLFYMHFLPSCVLLMSPRAKHRTHRMTTSQPQAVASRSQAKPLSLIHI